MKRIGKIKRISVLCLIFLLSINSFAASITNNDGSAFITKAEFDALKSTFQAQIDTYNQGIDSKIDGAIASYLSGVSLNTEPIEQWSTIMKNTYNKFRWTSMTVPSGTNASQIKIETNVTTKRAYNKKMVHVYTDMRSHGWVGQYQSDEDPGIIYQVGADLATARGEFQLMRSYVWNPGTFVSEYTAWDADPGHFWANWHLFTDYTEISQFPNTEIKQQGYGMLWELNKLPNDNYELKNYNSTAYLTNNINFNAYSYRDYTTGLRQNDGHINFQKWYTIAGGNDETTKIQIDLDKGTEYTVLTKNYGTKPASDEWNSATDWSEGSQILAWMKVNDGIDYSYFYWGTNCAQNLYCITDDVKPDWSSAVKTVGSDTTNTYHTYIRPYYPYTGPHNEDVKVSRIDYSYYIPTIAPKTYRLNNISNRFVSNMAGETIYHGNGAPCFTTQCVDANIIVKDIKIKLLEKDNITPATGKVKIMLSKNKFVNGNYANALDEIFEKEYDIVNASGEGTFDTDTFKIKDTNQQVWINIVNTTDKLVVLESLNPKLAY